MTHAAATAPALASVAAGPVADAAVDLRAKVRDLAAALNGCLVERRRVIDGAIRALVAGENVLLLGPPGNAKSMVSRLIAQAFGGTYFETLLTAFSTPEEVFGPVSLKGIENDRFERVTAGYLPEAHFAFLDEIFKANSAILNALLTAINEKTFRNGAEIKRLPLLSVVAASNELPAEGENLSALWDRFLVRYEVGYLASDDNFRAMLRAGRVRKGGDASLGVALTLADLTAIRAEVADLPWSEAAEDALIALRRDLAAEGIVASDRRWNKAQGLCAAAAWIAGESEVAPEDLSCLADVLWTDPKDRAKVARIVGAHADPVGAQADEILDAAREEARRVAKLPTTDRSGFVAAATKALENFKAQRARLEILRDGAGKRATAAIGDAQAEIEGMRSEIARAVAVGLGLRR